MTSLKFIEKEIENLESIIRMALIQNDLLSKDDYAYKMNLKLIRQDMAKLKYLKQIKQKLEIFEILNKYIKVEPYRPIGYKDCKIKITMSVYEEIPINYFGVTENLYKFTEEEMQKLKSWIKDKKSGDSND